MLFGTSLSKKGGSTPVAAATAQITTQLNATTKASAITTQPLASTPTKRNYADIATPSPVSGTASPQSAKTPTFRHDGKTPRK